MEFHISKLVFDNSKRISMIIWNRCRSFRLDTESKQAIESYSPVCSTQPSLTSLTHTIESEFAHLSTDTFSYELKPLHEKPSIDTNGKTNEIPVNDYELTCRLIEINMPIVPPLKIKLTLQYPNEPPEILSLSSATSNQTPAKLENSGFSFNDSFIQYVFSYWYCLDGHNFFETISRNFVYFLFKLPSQHTVTDILDIWVKWTEIYWNFARKHLFQF